MGKRIFKLLSAGICATGITGLATMVACSCGNGSQPKPEEESKLSKIEITSSFDDLNLEINETYTSNTIEVKCFDNNDKEIKSDVSFKLTSMNDNSLDISIADNKLHIGQNKKKGQYTYQIEALNSSSTVISTPKNININVYENLPLADEISISGEDSVEFMTTCDKPINLNLIGKKDGKVLDRFQSDCNLEMGAVYPNDSCKQDIFGNPTLSLAQDENIIKVIVSKDIDATYVGEYTVYVKATLKSDPNIYAVKQFKISIINGTVYRDRYYGFVYERTDAQSKWYLSYVPSKYNTIDASMLKTKIYEENDVIGIGDDFCSKSGISRMVYLQLPDSYWWIGNRAFANQGSLATLNAPHLQMVGEYAFSEARSLQLYPTKSEDLTFIGKSAFSGCKKLKIEELSNIEVIQEKAFEGSGITDITFGQNLLSIGDLCFNNCESLNSISINTDYVPLLMGELIGGLTPDTFKIHVKSTAISNYLEDPQWLLYSNKIVGDL